MAMNKAQRQEHLEALLGNSGASVVKIDRNQSSYLLSDDPVELFAMQSAVKRIYPELTMAEEGAVAENVLWSAKRGTAEVVAYESGTVRFIHIASIPRSAITAFDREVGVLKDTEVTSQQSTYDAQTATELSSKLTALNEGL